MYYFKISIFAQLRGFKTKMGKKNQMSHLIKKKSLFVFTGLEYTLNSSPSPSPSPSPKSNPKLFSP
jgi:hypothetical protein